MGVSAAHEPATCLKRSFLLHADDEVIHRLAAIHQGDLHIGMELVFQGALGLFRLLLVMPSP